MNKKIKITLIWLFIILISFAFLSLCNWNFNIKYWNGFSRFILGCEGILYIINLVRK